LDEEKMSRRHFRPRQSAHASQKAIQKAERFYEKGSKEEAAQVLEEHLTRHPTDLV